MNEDHDGPEIQFISIDDLTEMVMRDPSIMLKVPDSFRLQIAERVNRRVENNILLQLYLTSEEMIDVIEIGKAYHTKICTDPTCEGADPRLHEILADWKRFVRRNRTHAIQIINELESRVTSKNPKDGES